jgi:hypothetical protein
MQMHHDSRLQRWWPEQRAAALLRQTVIPDGHGIWHTGGRSSAWFLEYDTGSEDLPRLVAKIAGYEKAARTGGPAYPVLLWLHSRTREDNLHRLLSGLATRCPVATAARTAAPAGPTSRVWWPLGGGGRLCLHQLGGHVDTRGDWRDEHQLPEHQP